MYCCEGCLEYIMTIGFAGLAAYQRIYFGVFFGCASAEKVVKRHEVLAVMVKHAAYNL